MKVVFISGKYRDKDWYRIDLNIQKAKIAAIDLWKRGFVVICPHLNTAHFDGLCDDNVWLTGDLEILKRCDVIYMLKNWEDSEGAKAELELAIKLGLEIIYQ
jgi:hypothetical protein